jgi:hypothetical protein
MSADDQIKYDLSSWNLDFIHLKGPPTSGKILPLKFPMPPESVVGMNFTPIGTLVLLERNENRIWELDFDKGDRIPVWWDSTSPQGSDLFMSGRKIYVLAPELNEIRVGTWSDAFVGTDNRVVFTGRIQLPAGLVDASTRLAVIKNPFSQLDTIFLAPLTSGQSCTLRYGVDSSPRLLPFGVDQKLAIGNELVICPDWRANSIIVADVTHHRIGEFYIGTGDFKILCGTGIRGVSAEGTNALRTKVNAPCALALSRPRDTIREELLRKQSWQVVNGDPTGILPRTILFAEPSSSSIRRLVELPEMPTLLELSGFKGVYTLIGPNAKGDDTAAEGAGQLRRPIEAHKLAVSEQGELAVLTRGDLLLFRPATAEDGYLLADQSKASGSDWT